MFAHFVLRTQLQPLVSVRQQNPLLAWRSGAESSIAPTSALYAGAQGTERIRAQRAQRRPEPRRSARHGGQGGKVFDGRRPDEGTPESSEAGILSRDHQVDRESGGVEVQGARYGGVVRCERKDVFQMWITVDPQSLHG